MVLHFGIPMNSPHVKVLDTWRTLGMRGTGSHDVLIEGHVVPEAAVAREAQGRRVASAVPDHRHHRLPAHLFGLSRRRRKRARHRRRARQAQEARTATPSTLAGRMETELAGARLARRVDAGGGAPQCAVGRDHQPGDDRPAAGRASRHRGRRATRWSWPAAPASTARPGWSGASATSRRARYHPLQAGPQAEYAGAMALGLPIEKVF